MNKYLKNLNRIEFVVTLACTGRCKHCSQGEHKSSESIDKTLSADAVRKIASEYDIKSVMTFGGEPLLCSETVCEIHRAAREMNIPKRQLITNGFFSKDSEKIKLIAKEIIDNGVNEILISVDAFHQETIPLNYVKEFITAVNIPSINVMLHPAWLVNCENDNPYNRKTREILASLDYLGVKISNGNDIFPAGNALRYLGEYFDLNKEAINPYDEDPYNIKAICLSANGNILSGNIYKQDILGILDSYSPADTSERK